MTTTAPPADKATAPDESRPSLMTADEFLDRSDSDLYELVDGALRERTMSYRSAWIGNQIAHHFTNYALEQGGEACGDGANFRCFGEEGRNVRKPDATYIASGRIEGVPEAACEVVPDVVVEVISPSDTANDVDEKRLLYQASGVRAVLIVHPKSRTVDVWTAGGAVVLEDGETLELPDVMPGFALPLSKIFPPPQESEKTAEN